MIIFQLLSPLLKKLTIVDSNKQTKQLMALKNAIIGAKKSAKKRSSYFICKQEQGNTVPYYIYAAHINTPRVITRASDNEMVWRYAEKRRKKGVGLHYLQTGAGNTVPYYIYADHINTPRVITRPSDNAMVWRWDHAEQVLSLIVPKTRDVRNALRQFGQLME